MEARAKECTKPVRLTFKVNGQNLGECNVKAAGKHLAFQQMRHKGAALDTGLTQELQGLRLSTLDRIDCLFAVPSVARRLGFDIDATDLTKELYSTGEKVTLRLRILSILTKLD
ncbi:unnamed protein product [Sympodiomycopsis kandeliae]